MKDSGHLASAFCSLREGVAVVDRESRILVTNPALQKLSGRSEVDLQGVRLPEMLSSQGSPGDPKGRAYKARTSMTRLRVIHLRHASGERIPVRWSASVIDDERTVHSFADLRTELDLEERLADTERLRLIGQVLGGVAHDLNNPLAIILGYTDVLRGTVLAHADLEAVEKIGAAADHCRVIVARLLHAVRRPATDFVPGDLREPVSDAVGLMAPMYRREGVEIEWEEPVHNVVLPMDRDALMQMVLNLMANARDAIQEVGGLGRIRVELSVLPDRQALLSVSDDGPGIAPEIRDRVTEAFFTTKAPGKGTGLGLAMAAATAAAHGGRLEVGEGDLGGARVQLRVPLPVSVPGADFPRESEGPAPGSGGRAPRGSRVLVVDDQIEFLDLARRALSEMGLERLDAVHDGVEAFRRILAVPYDLVVCDLRMPRMDGLGLYRTVASALGDGTPRFLFSTGGADDPETEQLILRTSSQILRKPYRLTELCQSVIDCLARPGGRRDPEVPAGK